MEGFEKIKWKKINTPWGKPSDEILTAKLGKTKRFSVPETPLSNLPSNHFFLKAFLLADQID